MLATVLTITLNAMAGVPIGPGPQPGVHDDPCWREERRVAVHVIEVWRVCDCGLAELERTERSPTWPPAADRPLGLRVVASKPARTRHVVPVPYEVHEAEVAEWGKALRLAVDATELALKTLRERERVIAELRASVARLTLRIRELEGRIASLDGDLASEAARARALQLRIFELESRPRSPRDEALILELQAEIGRLEARIGRLEELGRQVLADEFPVDWP